MEPDNISNIKFTFQCKQQWDRLQATTDPDVRFCSECNLRVRAISNILDLHNLELRENCIAVHSSLQKGTTIVGGMAPRSLPSQDNHR
jgi:hypothetical protein